MTTDELKKHLGDHKWSLLIGFAMLAMVAFGYNIARKIDEGDGRKVAAQKATITLLTEENNQLTTRVNQLEIALELAKLEKQDITAALAQERKDVVKLMEKVAFYERVMAPEKAQQGFVVEGVKVTPSNSEREYHVSMVLLQQSTSKRVLRGKLNIAIEGEQNGETVTLSTSNGKLASGDIAYRFKFFQAVNTSVTLPEGFTPREIILASTVYQYNTRKGNYTLNIPWDAALDDQNEEEKEIR
jgi:electron transfer flavoprotein alpha subunit